MSSFITLLIAVLDDDETCSERPFIMADAKQDAPSGGDAVPSASSPQKVVIKNVDMTDEMQQETVNIAQAALDKFTLEKDIASNVKKEFDRKYGPTWHVVVGKRFGSYVTHGG